MFDGDFDELVLVIKKFGEALIHVIWILIKSFIFWGVALLPFIIGLVIGIMNMNIIWIFCGLLVEVFWALIFIWSDSR